MALLVCVAEILSDTNYTFTSVGLEMELFFILTRRKMDGSLSYRSIF